MSISSSPLFTVIDSQNLLRSTKRTHPFAVLLVLAYPVLNDDFLPVEYPFAFYFHLRHLLLEFVAVTDIPLCEEIILDPKHLPKSFDNSSFLFKLEPRMREDSLD